MNSLRLLVFLISFVNLPHIYAAEYLEKFTTSLTQRLANATHAVYSFTFRENIASRKISEDVIDIAEEYDIKQLSQAEADLPITTKIHRQLNMFRASHQITPYVPVIRDLSQPIASALVIASTYEPRLALVGLVSAQTLILLKELKPLIDRWEKYRQTP